MRRDRGVRVDACERRNWTILGLPLLLTDGFSPGVTSNPANEPF